MYTFETKLVIRSNMPSVGVGGGLLCCLGSSKDAVAVVEKDVEFLWGWEGLFCLSSLGDFLAVHELPAGDRSVLSV